MEHIQSLLNRLDASGSEEQEAAARIRELESQLAEANARIARLQAEKKEVEQECDRAIEKKQAEREHSVWLREECNKAVDAMEEANERAESAGSQLAELRAKWPEVENVVVSLEARLAEANRERDAERASANLEHTERLIAQRNESRCRERATRLEAALKQVEYIPNAAEGMEGFQNCLWCEAFSDEPHASDCARQLALADDAERPDDSEAGLVWPKNKVRQVKGKRGETRVRPPFVISDDDERPKKAR